MRKYTFKLTILEIDDEFWEGIRKKKSTGCDELTEELRAILEGYGFYDSHLVLEEFHDK